MIEENYYPIIREKNSFTSWTDRRERGRMFLILVFVCFPFSLPSLYLAFRLYKIRHLDSIFNQHVGLMMVFSGKSFIVNNGFYDKSLGLFLPLNLATAILRLLIENYPEALADYEPLVPQLCNNLAEFHVAWINPCYYMSITAIVFRSQFLLLAPSSISKYQSKLRHVLKALNLSIQFCKAQVS